MKEGKKWNQDRSCEGMSENLKIIKVCLIENNQGKEII